MLVAFVTPVPPMLGLMKVAFGRVTWCGLTRG